MTAATAARAYVVPASADLYACFAAALVERERAALPDLSTLTILLPPSAPVAALRRALLQAAGGALLGPRVLTLAQFAAGAADQAPLPAIDCRLMLVAALRRQHTPFPDQDPWQLADALFDIFESLDAESAALPDSAADFEQRLQRAYGARPLAALSREARIVHQLWQAFRIDSAQCSPARLQAAALQRACEQLPGGQRLHLLGHERFSGTERAALQPLIDDGRAELWLHGRLAGRDGAALRRLCAQLGVEAEPLPAAPTDRAVFLDTVFDSPRPAREVATPQLRIVAADGPEHEARCVELAIREALLAGSTDIAVVTEDRRLARRLRALLERAQIVLDDEIGWTLSTSAAAAALNAWLDALDSGFQFRPLLALLKSSFLQTDDAALTELERDLVYRRGIESGLEHFRSRATGAALRALLDRLSAAAAGWPSAREPRSGERWLAALRRSLTRLGLIEPLQADDAGRAVLDTLDALQSAFTVQPLPQAWSEFRALLDRALENAMFRPQRRGPVRLLTLERCAGLRCDALILAAATRALLPPPPGGEPFFNQSVRAELGLPTVEHSQQLALARLRRVLEAAPQVTISYAADSAGEPAQLSPWIEAIESFATSRGIVLRDVQLARRAGSAAVEIADRGGPAAVQRYMPAPRVPTTLLPEQLSATAHQSLMDCPYQFYVRGALRLRAEQAPDEDPDRSDYGSRVHKILEAFTQPVSGLPEAFAAPVTAANRAEAEARLLEIADAVFAPDLRERALAHVWLTEFRATVPLLIDWLVDRPAVPALAEQQIKRTLDARWTLDGTADRIEERGPGQRTIVDYKTGRRLPRLDEVRKGEAVQLIHYALLDERVDRVEYLNLGGDGKTLVVEGEELATLRQDVEDRLREVLDALSRWAPLPANGDELVCSRCDYSGLCRKRDWVSKSAGEALLRAFANARPGMAGPVVGKDTQAPPGTASTSPDPGEPQ